MPNRILTNDDTFNSLNKWLDQNLQEPFRANTEYLPDNNNSRGIYFWFMKSEGYPKLSALGLNISAINPAYKKLINEETYDLVYIGTAGANRKESNTLFKRLNWHLSDKHNENNICHGTISTLRHTVGSALSDDLIIPNTENDVNEFFSDYFYVCTLPYTGQANTKERIDNDEYYLISVLKPLFNIKNNPNARITAGQNPTRQLKVRRGLVIHNTRERLGCKKDNNGKAKSKKDDNKPPQSPINNFEFIYEKDGCQEFTVTKEQSVHDVVSGIEGLPTSKCEIVIYDSANPNEYIYTSKHKSGKRVTGTKKNTIYGYFSNSDTSNQPRWKVIQQEMLDKGVAEITVRVCSDAPNELEPSKEKRGRPKKNEMNKTEVLPMNKPQVLEKLENRKKDEPVLLILGCSDSKARGGTEIQNNYFNSECLNNKRVQTINNYNQSIAAHPNKFNKNRNDNPVNANYFGNCQNKYMEALDRYCTNRSIFYKPNQIALYRQKINEGKLHILILSGLYGVLKWDDRIIDYHYKFNSLNSLYNTDSCVLDNIQKYIAVNNIEAENVFYSLSNNGQYQEMLTPNMPNNWSFVWINGGRGHKTASFLFNDFLPAL